MNLKIEVFASPTTADFNLTVQAYDVDNQPMATLGTVNVDDPNLGIRLRDLFQAFRMGMMYGHQSVNAIEQNATYGKPNAVNYVSGYPSEMAGSDLPARDDGMGDTAIQHHAR